MPPAVPPTDFSKRKGGCARLIESQGGQGPATLFAQGAVENKFGV